MQLQKTSSQLAHCLAYDQNGVIRPYLLGSPLSKEDCLCPQNCRANGDFRDLVRSRVAVYEYKVTLPDKWLQQHFKAQQGSTW